MLKAMDLEMMAETGGIVNESNSEEEDCLGESDNEEAMDEAAKQKKDIQKVTISKFALIHHSHKNINY